MKNNINKVHFFEYKEAKIISFEIYLDPGYISKPLSIKGLNFDMTK